MQKITTILSLALASQVYSAAPLDLCFEDLNKRSDFQSISKIMPAFSAHNLSAGHKLDEILHDQMELLTKEARKASMLAGDAYIKLRNDISSSASWKRCQEAFTQALPDHANAEEAFLAVGSFRYFWLLTQPANQGSNILGRWLSGALHLRHQLPPLKEEMDWQKLASTSSLEAFVQQYVSSSKLDCAPLSDSGVRYTANHPRLSDIVNQFREHYFTLVKDAPTDLCRIMRSHGSDKSSVRHNYTQMYDFLFRDRRQEKLNILEVGIGSVDPQFGFTMEPVYQITGGKAGASLRGWREYFPNSQIWGADIDEKALFSDDRIQCFYVDQLNVPTIEALFGRIPAATLDVIVDDGYHDFEAQRNLFLAAMPHLSENGVYIIEDVQTAQIPQFLQLLFGANQPYAAALVQLPSIANEFDNNIVIAIKK